MIIAIFLFVDETEKSRFFEEIFLLVNISMSIAFEILFYLTLNNAKINFINQKFN